MLIKKCFKNRLILLIIVLFNFFPAKSKINNSTLLGFATTGLFFWLLGEKIHKYYINKELKKYKNDTFSEELIIKAQEFLYNLKDKLRVYNLDSNSQNLSILASFKENLDIHTQIILLEKNFNENIKLILELKSKIPTWEQTNKETYITKSKNLIKKLKYWKSILKNSIEFAKINKNTQNLQNLSQNLKLEYYQEILTLNSQDNTYIINTIDSIILEKFNSAKYLFPRISYIEELSVKITKLEKLIKFSKFDYQKYKDIIGLEKIEYINNQEKLLSKLKNISKIISLSKNYIYEKEKKPKYENEQELIKIQIKELEAKIKAEAQKQRIKLQKEINFTKKLENEKREQELRKKEVKLELARIKNNKLKDEYENKLINLEKKLSEYKSKINVLNIEIKKNKDYIEALKNNIEELEKKLPRSDKYFEPSAPTL